MKGYKNDIANIICEEISIADVLGMMNWHEGRHSRTRCPLHDGKDNNFSYNENLFQCWVCGEKGNVIQLVMKYYGIDFKQALYKLNDYFRLNLINGKKDYQQRAEQREIDKERAIGKNKTEEYNRSMKKELEAVIDTLKLLETIEDPSPEVLKQISYYEMLFEDLNDRQGMWNDK